MSERKTLWIDEWCGNRFNTREEAVASAKRNAQRNHQDVAIWRQDPVAIVRFPLPDYQVDELVAGETATTG